MSIHRISREEFDSLSLEKMGFFPEKSWFKSTEIDIAGTVIKDPIDKDWSYVIVAKEEDGIYRYVKGEVSPGRPHECLHFHHMTKTST
ncbi:hypothetical protein AAEI00_20890 [Shewanella algae]|uniref:hypothetical protein n=1 Tax=Shewanella algae TaxID=38313 RepID=UPI0031980E46